ncbi:MAG: FAD-dependent oxidoreductase [Candidatus Eiseniibacteriota bacterium]
MADERLKTQCCIAGGGPAGMMLGLLLARAGVEVVVLEKHADFLRDFRGDTIHPSTLELMWELGLLEDFLKLPHQKVRTLYAGIGNATYPVADFSHLPEHCRFVALMPQWDFLNFIAEQARRYPTFTLKMRAEAVGLIKQGGIATGLQVTTPEGGLEVGADLVVGADGRHSTVRISAGFAVDGYGAPIDVLWFRLSRCASDPDETLGRFDAGHIFIMLNRGEHWQCAFVIPKGAFERVKGAGLAAFRASVAQLAPSVADRVDEISDWDRVKLLTVQVDRLRRWYSPRLLCIGDAAHAMSPIGGVGINLAIQDAVAAANILAEPLREGRLTLDHLAQVQKRREFPTRVTQRFQVIVQNRIIARVLSEKHAFTAPWPIKLMQHLPFLRRIPARMIGVGVRPEHVRTPELARPADRASREAGAASA